jgi:hypothetical protein
VRQKPNAKRKERGSWTKDIHHLATFEGFSSPHYLVTVYWVSENNIGAMVGNWCLPPSFAWEAGSSGFI